MTQREQEINQLKDELAEVVAARAEIYDKDGPWSESTPSQREELYQRFTRRIAQIKQLIVELNGKANDV